MNAAALAADRLKGEMETRHAEIEAVSGAGRKFGAGGSGAG